MDGTNGNLIDKAQQQQEQQENGGDRFDDDNITNNKRGCFQWLSFDGVNEAKGYCRLGMARGPLVMSNIFLSKSLIYLASQAAGCLEPPEDDGNNSTMIDVPNLDSGYDWNVDEDCDNRVYGFLPSSFISNIAVIAGLLSAFTMPMVGAIIDYTHYRRPVGILSALMIILIQAIQIGTLSATWYPMAILQAIAAWLYQIQVLATYAYLPDMATIVGETKMSEFSGSFVMVQFMSQLSFLIIITIVGLILGMNDVRLGQLSQAANVATCIIFFYLGWNILPSVPPKHALGENQRLITQGFVQTWQTAMKINRNYKRSLRWYLLSVVFGEAATNAFTSVSVIYMGSQLEMSGLQIGIVFLITLLSTVIGTVIATHVSKKTNPNTSWKIGLATFVVFTVAGGFILTGPDRQLIVYPFGFFWGVCLGWFYPTENLFFSLILPKGQEAELTGFFIYCTQILVWLPPLVFTALIEAGVDQSYGLMSINIYFVIAIVILCFMPSWEETLQEVGNLPVNTTTNNHDHDSLDQEQETPTATTLNSTT